MCNCLVSNAPIPQRPQIPWIVKNRKILGFMKTCTFFNPFMIFYDLVMKQVRNSYKYSWDLAGFGLNRHDTVTNSLRFAIIYNMEILQRLRISQELDKNMLNACTNQAQIYEKLWQFVSIRGIFSHDRYMLPGYQFQNEYFSYGSCSIDPTTWVSKTAAYTLYS